MLEDYIIDDRLRYEDHYLKVAGTDVEIGGVAGAALLSALIVDTEEGVRRGIAIDSDAERMAWIKQYEREVRRDEWGLLGAEVELLNNAYIDLATSEVKWADICPNVRLLDLALQLVTTYMRYLTVETFRNHIWECCPWDAPFAQWLLNAAEAETRRQQFLHTNWTDPAQVNALYEHLLCDDQNNEPTFIFEGEDAEDIYKRYLTWVWTSYQAQIREIPGSQPRTARHRNYVVEQETNWAFNNDELMINILNRDYEVNKQSIYVTVRDVEDLNGNPMSSPVTWTAFVDRNALKWSEKQLIITCPDNADTNPESLVRIVNTSGKRHQYTIESLPLWLSIEDTYGAIDPMEEKQVWLTFNRETPVGEYSDIVYLTDEDGLSEPLRVEYTVKAIPPYEEVDEGAYPLNMSVCAKVMLATENGAIYDTDERDIVYAMYRNECVGQANVSINPVSNTTDVYLTVLGNDDMTRQPITFHLWQASTGKVYDLITNRNITFAHGYVYGCGDNTPLILTTSGSERQQIALNAGWNWVSTNLDLTATRGELNTCMSAAQPWTEGDIIKNPNKRQFSTYNASNNAFVGSLNSLHHSQIYMIYSANANTMRISGEALSEDSMKITVHGDGQWSVIPCLFDQRTTVTEALADYYQNATPGDLIKSHNRFATFSTDRRWVGDLNALQPGEGYLFRRMDSTVVQIHFYNRNAANMPKKSTDRDADRIQNTDGFSNPNASTNMTMIARVNGENGANDANDVLKVYVNDELAAVATPIDSLYFLTIQSDQVGELRFEIDGQILIPEDGVIKYSADEHAGSIKAPVVLKPIDETGRKVRRYRKEVVK